MIIERDVAIPADDGVILRADVFRPDNGQPAPVIMSLGPYGKGVEYKEGYAPQWQWLMQAHPNVLPNSTKSFMTWETVDPETWVPWGYVCIRVDSRGSGRTPGVLDLLSPREIKDYYDAIEWAGIQKWSNGKVGPNSFARTSFSQCFLDWIERDFILCHHSVARCIPRAASSGGNDSVGGRRRLLS